MKPSSCDLVWCSEHCYKNVTKGLREELAAIARRCSADLVCLKKAAKYVTWSSSSDRCLRPVALLTDWREAKPCVRASAEGASPIITFVYCDAEQSFNRALAWKRHLNPKDGCVHVVSKITDLEPLLLHALGAMQEDPKQLVSNKKGALQRSKCLRDDTRADEEHRNVVVDTIATENMVQQRSSFEVEVQKVESAMQHTLIHLVQCSTQMERTLVEKLLTLAMPDHYDD